MATLIIRRASPNTIINARLLTNRERRLFSTPPRARRGAAPEKSSWFSFRSSDTEKKVKVLAEGQATGKEIMKAFGVAFGIQFIFCGVSMSAEAISELRGTPMIPEIPGTVSALGIIVSGFGFRHFLKPSWAKKRWYFMLAPLGIASIVSTALFVRTFIFPEEPPLPEEEAKELEAVANALNLKCFEGPQALTLQACTMAWSKIFAKISDEYGNITKQSILSCDPNEPLIRASGCHNLLNFLQQPQSQFALQGLHNVLSVAGGNSRKEGKIGMKEFAVLMLAIQSAHEGHSSNQCELMFRLMNTAGNGRLTENELGKWLELLMSEETCAASFDEDIIKDGWGLFGSSTYRITTAQLARDYMKRFSNGKQHLTYPEFKELCENTNLRFSMMVSMAFLVVDSSPANVGGMLLQFLMLNPSAGLVAKKKVKEGSIGTDVRDIAK